MLFYLERVDEATARMSPEEAHHCVRVLRLKPGDVIEGVDGAGGYYKGVLHAVSPAEGVVHITETVSNWREPDRQLGIAIPMLKARDHIEWCLEKAVELGATHIYLTRCGRSERTTYPVERARHILIAALKQSRRSRLPHFSICASFSDFITETNIFTNRLLAHMQAAGSLNEAATRLEGATIVAIGPEGDFTEAEIETARQHNFQFVHLGLHRLRSETACLYALSLLRCHCPALDAPPY